MLPYRVDVRFGRSSEAGNADTLLKQGEREKGGVAFIQMENCDIGVPSPRRILTPPIPRIASWQRR
jgi:hypothetical protein